MGGFFRKIRAIASRCFCPPESFTPRSPTGVSSPCGRLSSKVSSRARRAAARTSASVAPSRP